MSSGEAGTVIAVLPDDLANQIAAGEVVERPASVVKELVENAIDAGARRIHVDVEGGGIALVRVVDDGSGMGRRDAALATQRHATSKIAHLDDLRAISTFGFRGEALPSIASVSRFALRTRRADEDEGTLVEVVGGAPATVGPAGAAPGTSVEVRELFFNVPARRKFLRAVATESAHVTDVVLAAALAQPERTFVLTRDGRLVREWLHASGRDERVRAVLDDLELGLCLGTRGPLTAQAFLSRPERARTGASWLHVFVNGRPVRDRALSRAVAQAYGSVLEPGRFPVGVVYLDLPHDLVDVNVHPQKAEVRFADARAVADALYRIVSDGLRSAFGLAPPERRWGERKTRLYEDAPPGSLATWAWSTAPDPAGLAAAPTAPGADPWELSPPSPAISQPVPTLASPEPVPYPLPSQPPPSTKPARFGTLRFVAQLRRTFLLCEGEDGLYLLDQHAAAERVTFDRLRRSWQARDVAVQKLLFPVVVAVEATEAALLDEAQDDIAAAGVDLRLAGPTSVAIHAIPSLLGKVAPDRLARDLLAELGRSGGRAFSGAIDRALATAACHGSVRAGDTMSPAEATALLGALDAVDFAGHCPHGRPILMRIGWSELEQRVGRR